ncbi:uncharacterized protein LOC110050311 isoform X2 [Orbicella faveolata]|uniref:uncharacterized protein LOC110050311 isoform X2 n=1 Tax=Orbicella faveolata TaxID=48498 RepID=UPI0009E5F942|nr:uncharacterized protein LOC110050311 isoform X2 [Orbicella faveolata]
MLESGIYVRDFGTRLEEINLEKSDVAKEIEHQKAFWHGKGKEIESPFKELYQPTQPAPASKGRKGRMSKKLPQKEENKELSSYAGTLTKEFLIKVCSLWKEIAVVTRDREFDKDEEHLIDIFDIKCKEWGFLLLELFGTSLGTGDYGHLMIEHVPMLFRVHRSLHDLSNQGFEAAHKLQRQLYARATSHDSPGNTSSLDQILTYLFTEKFLDMRLSFREAYRCITSGKKLNCDHGHESCTPKSTL